MKCLGEAPLPVKEIAPCPPLHQGLNYAVVGPGTRFDPIFIRMLTPESASKDCSVVHPQSKQSPGLRICRFSVVVFFLVRSRMRHMALVVPELAIHAVFSKELRM